MNFDHKPVESSVERLWKRETKRIEQCVHLEKGKPLFSFLEGPPTANAPPALHHLEARVFKDLVCRYKYMKGFTVPRKGGWDCHGLPVEVQVEKELGLNSKKEVVDYGIGKFNETCRKEVFSHISEWNRFTKKMGYWIDLKDPYITFTNDYIESVWWSLKVLHDKKLLYEGYKVVPYCPHCETPLSSHEVAQGYKSVTADTVTVRFKIKGEDRYLLSWTTTPWTLPSNLCLAVNPDLTYAVVRRGHEEYILAKSRVAHYFPDGAEIVKEMKGSDLAGIEYEPLFDYFVGKVSRPVWVVVTDTYITGEDGTGIVHTAPAYGEADYETCKKHKLPFVHPVNRDGTFTDDVRDFAGKFVIDADPLIVDYLSDKGAVFSSEKFTHDYPYCWRCKSPLLYYAMTSWFIRMSGFRRELLKQNKGISWYPSHIKDGRFGKWLEEVKDWALSRTKFWGTPLPIWRCGCGNEIVVGSVAELREKAFKAPKDLDLHKPAIDEVKLKCRCGSWMERVPDVIDTWYDSGAAPFAQFHYPFENKKEFESRFPYDFIAEAVDQTRGWFYTLLAISTLLFKRPAYLSCVCAGHLVDDNGEKMSKSKGNIINPWDIFDKYGVDAARLMMVTTAPGESKSVGPKTAEATVVPFLNTIWNSYLYTKALGKPRKAPLRTVDKWMVSRANTMVRNVELCLEVHEYNRCFEAMQSFIVEDLSRWYIKAVRGRDDGAVAGTLHYAFGMFARALAPFAPYLSDFLWSELGNKGSVHFERWPSKLRSDTKLEAQMDVIRNIVEASNSAKQEKSVKLKYPLRAMTLSCDAKSKSAVTSLKPLLLAMANVKDIKFGSAKMSYTAKVNFAVAGKKFGAKVKDIAKALETADAAALKRDISKGAARIAGTKLSAEDIIFTERSEEGKPFDGGSLYMDFMVDGALRGEWLVRELIRAVQDARKKMKLNVKHKVTLTLPPEKAFKVSAKTISKATGSRVVFGAAKGNSFEFEGNKYSFGVKK